MIRYKNFVIFETKEDLQTHCEAIVPPPAFWAQHGPNDVDYKFEGSSIMPSRRFPCGYERCEGGSWASLDLEFALKKIKKQANAERKQSNSVLRLLKVFDTNS